MDDSGKSSALSWEEFFARFSREEVPDDFLTEDDRNQGQNVDRELFEMVSMSRFGALADAWESVSSNVLSTTRLAGMQPHEMHDASEAIQGAIAAYIAATKDTRLLTLLYLMGHVERRFE